MATVVRAPRTLSTAQAWIEPLSEDPAATSAFEVASTHLDSARGLAGLRRARVIELAGRLPGREALEERFHRSTWIYNPHKERCRVRLAADEPPPLDDTERAVLVWERSGETRPAIERWWRHEGGGTVAVREGVVWIVRGRTGAEAMRLARALAELRDREHGLLCNPHAQEYRVAEAEVPLPWFPPARRRRAAARRTG